MKILRILIIFFFMTGNAFALNSLKNPTADDDGWDSFTAFYAYDGVDNTYATVSYDTGRIVTYWGYGFALPTYAKVLGVEVLCEASHNAECSDWGTLSVKITLNGGTNWSSAKATSSLTTSDVVYTLGGTSNLWGLTPTAARINSDNFQTQVTSGGCIVEGSLINVPNGVKKVENLKPGDEVFSFDGKDYQKDIIESISEDKTDKVYIINNELTVTGAHPVFCVEKNDYVIAEELKTGDTLKYLKAISKDNFEVVNKKISDIRTEDRKARVFNLAVKGNKNFWASGYLVHNKGSQSCQAGYTYQWKLDTIQVRVTYSIPWIAGKVFYQDRYMTLIK